MDDINKSVAGMIKQLMDENPELSLKDATAKVMEKRRDILTIEIIQLNKWTFKVRTKRVV